jgi:hypothetical protein
LGATKTCHDGCMNISITTAWRFERLSAYTAVLSTENDDESGVNESHSWLLERVGFKDQDRLADMKDQSWCTRHIELHVTR